MQRIWISVVMLVLLGVAATLLPVPAGAQWLDTQKREFLAQCDSGCARNPNVGNQTERCPIYCRCLVREGEKIFSAEDYDELDQLARRGGDSPKLQRFRELFPVCNRHAFSD